MTMDVLTLKEINNSFPEKVYQFLILHNPEWWEEIDLEELPTPDRVKFDSNIQSNIPGGIRENKGIYMFFLEPKQPFEPDVKNLIYIGRVKEGTTNFNFHKRFYDYVKNIGKLNASRNKVLLTNLWPNHTYVYFYSLNQKTDDEITEIEDILIKKILPPLNFKIGGKAGQTRQMYN